VPRLQMSGAAPLLLLFAVMPAQGQPLPLPLPNFRVFGLKKHSCSIFFQF